MTTKAKTAYNKDMEKVHVVNSYKPELQTEAASMQQPQKRNVRWLLILMLIITVIIGISIARKPTTTAEAIKENLAENITIEVHDATEGKHVASDGLLEHMVQTEITCTNENMDACKIVLKYTIAGTDEELNKILYVDGQEIKNVLVNGVVKDIDISAQVYEDGLLISPDAITDTFAIKNTNDGTIISFETEISKYTQNIDTCSVDFDAYYDDIRIDNLEGLTTAISGTADNGNLITSTIIDHQNWMDRIYTDEDLEIPDMTALDKHLNVQVNEIVCTLSDNIHLPAADPSWTEREAEIEIHD